MSYTRLRRTSCLTLDYDVTHIVRVMVEPDTLENGESAFHAFCPALKGCHTWGRSYHEALANIREAVELYVDDLRASGEFIPHVPEGRALEWSTPAVAVNV